jgi:hypothetical protein
MFTTSSTRRSAGLGAAASLKVMFKLCCLQVPSPFQVLLIGDALSLQAGDAAQG